jgi:hypothetical protein
VIAVVAIAVPAVPAAPAGAAPTDPVLELLAPFASPACANATAVLTAAPGSVLAVCDTVPAPRQRLSCQADDGARAVLDKATGTATGMTLPADTRVAGPAVEEVVVIEDALPPPANSANLASQVKGFLACRVLLPPVEAAPPDDTEEPAPSSAAFDVGSLDDRFDFGSILASTVEPGPALAPVGLTTVAPAATTEPLGVIRTGGYAYPVVFVLPLVMLVLGGYVARSLTQPVSIRDRFGAESGAPGPHF